MEIQKDFSGLFASLNAHDVEYIIVGGYALAFLGAPRFTGDIDVWVSTDRRNAERIIAALADFGFSSVDLGIEDFQAADRVIQLGIPPVRIDFLTSLSGVSWQDAVTDAAAGYYGEIPVRYLGRSQFIANKRATGRRKDQADLEALGEE